MDQMAFALFLVYPMISGILWGISSAVGVEFLRRTFLYQDDRAIAQQDVEIWRVKVSGIKGEIDEAQRKNVMLTKLNIQLKRRLQEVTAQKQAILGQKISDLRKNARA